MPELPEVETVVRGLRPHLEGRTLQRVEQNCESLRFPLPEGFAQRLSGRRVLSISRRAKYMLLHLDRESPLDEVRVGQGLVRGPHHPTGDSPCELLCYIHWLCAGQ